MSRIDLYQKTLPEEGAPVSRGSDEEEPSTRSIYVIEHVVRGRWSPADRDRTIRQVAEVDGTSVPILLEQEPGSAGKSQVAVLTNVLAGFVVVGDRPTGPKEIRAEPLASQLEAGSVKLLKALWNRALIEEFCSFPHGSHDDIVDACSSAFNYLAGQARAWWEDREALELMKRRWQEKRAPGVGPRPLLGPKRAVNFEALGHLPPFPEFPGRG